MSNEILGLIALAVLFAVIFIGFPIAFTLGAVALGAGWFALGPVVFDLAVLQTYSVMKDTVLAAIPFFLFMGFLLEQSGIMERLFTGIQQLLSGLNGSLYLAVLITATIFAAATGIVGSSVTLLGVMAGPSMIKSGYDPKMSAGAITAGGTLGILIPPSVMLIVMGPVVGVPATDLFAAAVLPGLLLSGLFISWTLVRCWINPALGPALPPEMRPASLWPVVLDLMVGVLPVVTVILATLGVILAGIATPTDAGAVGCAGEAAGPRGLVRRRPCTATSTKHYRRRTLIIDSRSLPCCRRGSRSCRQPPQRRAHFVFGSKRNCTRGIRFG